MEKEENQWKNSRTSKNIYEIEISGLYCTVLYTLTTKRKIGEILMKNGVSWGLCVSLSSSGKSILIHS